MDFDIAAEDDPGRRRIRSWLERHPRPDGRTLAEGGWVVPHWPAPYGHGADPVFQLVIDEERAVAPCGGPGRRPLIWPRW